MSTSRNVDTVRAGAFEVRTILSLALMLSLLCLLVACSPAEPVPAESLTQLRVGVLPGDTPKSLRERHEPLVEYLSQELNLAAELIVPDDYASLVDLFRNGELDLAFFGGLTFVQASRQAGAVPLVMGDSDTRFTSYFLVHGSNAGRTLESFRGASFSFGPESSTSGHLMPRFFLREKEMDPEVFFGDVRYAGSHDTTAYWVRDGKVDLGVAGADIIDTMLRDGRLQEGDVHILWQSPPYSNYVWAVQSDLGAEWQIKIRDAFLQLSPEVDEHSKILSLQNAGGFLPAGQQDFARLENIAGQLNLLPEQGSR